MKKSVWLVLVICDDEYFCREVAFVGSTEEKAKEWIINAGGNYTVTGWDDRERDYYVIDEWRVDD